MMNTALTFREATSLDIPEVLRQRRGMYFDMGYRDEVGLDGMVATSQHYMEEAMANGSLHAWIAEIPDGNIAGGGVVIVSPWLSRPHSHLCKQANILNVYTYPAYRRQGVARVIVHTLIAWCRGQGFAYVSLHASADGKPLYELLGFEPNNEMRLKLR